MTSWLRGTPFNPYSQKILTTNSLPHEVDQDAAFSAFVRHWQQIVEVFHSSQNKDKVSADDVTAVINHFGQMINFLLVDLRRMTRDDSYSSEFTVSEQSKDSTTSQITSNEESHNGDNVDPISPHTPIFDHFLGERVLQSILQWSKTTAEFFNILQLEQLKVYETLLSNSHPEILVYKPITEPLLALLESCSGCVPVEVEKRLVVLLNQLWVSLMHNQHLLKYFYRPTDTHPPKFLIFSLLLPFIHREGGIGQQARDALLLSMSLSAKHAGVAEYVFEHSNFCPVLAAGLSGLYSMLPRSLTIKTEGWYRISPEDMATIPPLQMFMNSLGFCNAIVQIAHPQVQKQLVDYLYQGFLVPVVGPALIQTVLEEVVAAIVFVEFFLDSVTEEKLRRAFLALLLSPQEYSDLPLLTSIISHLHSPNVQLNLVTLNLFNTLIRLHSEDTMISLIFQYLTPCNHVMLSQRSKLAHPPFSSAERFIELFPTVCQVEAVPKTTPEDGQDQGNHCRQGYLVSGPDATSAPPPSFFVYLKEARESVAASYIACNRWTWPYDARSPSPTEATHFISAAKLIPVVPYTKPRVHSDPCSQSLPYEAFMDGLPLAGKERSSSLPIYTSEKSSSPNGVHEATSRTHHHPSESPSGDMKVLPKVSTTCIQHLVEAEGRLDSLGGSSGYESFNPKCSRDSSPLHGGAGSCNVSGGRRRSRGEDQRPPSSMDEKTLIESDDGFFLFLDQSQVHESPVEAGDELQFIDDFFQAVEGTRGTHKYSEQLRSEEQDSDLNSPWLSTSLSSAEEESCEDAKELLTSHPKPSIGPFLEALISQIDNMFTSNTEASLLAMRCISGLAAYPCPLLTALLLQPSVVLQPAVRSLYQVLGQLKQRVDTILTVMDVPIVADARVMFHQSLHVEAKREQTPPSSSSLSSTFVRGNDKRRSFSQTVSAFFKRTPPTERNQRRESLQNLPDGAGYRGSLDAAGGLACAKEPVSCAVGDFHSLAGHPRRYINSPASPSWQPPTSPFLSAPTEKRQAAVCAVLLQEWLLELAALAQEHTVYTPTLKFSTIHSASEGL